MSDGSEKTCPLCAEEMDLTDQQLKPCHCGYEICVWCWHHIMDMAEKDATEGRCPACRTPYDKEKIVGMAAKCERLVAEVTMEKKFKSQKSKAKSSEGRKQLTSVRVIQRNLVYIVGLPLNLADEDLLQHREYFGQYGKVLKVSMSRTAAGVIQQFPNNTCSVYITYSKEEEAIRCIQNVHQFVLEGKPLRACFGTTKYCHAWLRNVPCTNPDCLYLHEVGSQEDSFTKDEIISAFTRSRVQQITGAANNMQQRSGNVLPVPLDDYNINGSATTGKSVVKNAPIPAANIVRGSLPTGCSGRSIVLPAAASWATRGSNCQASPVVCSDGPVKQKTDTVSSTLAFSSAVAGITSITLNGEVGKRHTFGEETHIAGSKNIPEPLRLDSRSFHTERLVAPEGAPACIISDSYKGNNESPNKALVDHNGNSRSSFSQAESDPYIEGQIEDLSYNISSMGIDRNVLDESSVLRPSTSVSEKQLGLPEYYSERSTESMALQSSGMLDSSINDGPISREKCNWGSKSQKLGLTSDVEEDAISFGDQRLQDPEAVGHLTSLAPLVSLPNSLYRSGSHSLQNGEAFGASSLNVDSLFVDKKFNDNSFLYAPNISATSYNYPETSVGRSAASDLPFEHSFSLRNEVKGKNTGRLQGDASDVYGNGFVDKGESSIISNILSMDFDVWDNSLTSPQNLAKLLGEPDKESGSLSISSPWRAQNNSQSRFSFARQEESRKQALDIQSSFEVNEKMQNNHPFSHVYSQNGDVLFDKLRINNGLYPTHFDGSQNHSSIHSFTTSNQFSSVTRAQISAPPGFSLPSRAPPPGFSSHERAEQSFDNLYGNHLLDNSSVLRNAYMSSQNGNTVDTGDIEFMDPAILAVGKGRLHSGLNNPGLDIRSNFPPQLGAFENEHARLQLLMQRSIDSQQNLRFPDVGGGFSHLTDSYGISSRLMDQSQAANNLSHFAQLSLQQSRNGLANGHWDGWNEVQGGNGLGMNEMFRNDRLAFNKFYPGYENSKLRMHSLSDLNNRTFGL